MLATVLFSLFISSIAPLVACLPAHPGGHDLISKRQAGPSGYVVYPPGGTTWATIQNGDVGYPSSAPVIYQGVSQAFDRDEYTYFQTIAVDIYAMLPNMTGTPYYLVKGLAPVNGNLTMETSFLIPRDASFPHDENYQFSLVFVETQFATNPGYGETLSFQSAAPLLTVNYGMIP